MSAYVDSKVATKVAAVGKVTDSSGGTAANGVAAITAGTSYAKADMVAVRDALASLQAQVNALADLVAATVHSPLP